VFSSELPDEHVLHLRRKWEVSERVIEMTEIEQMSFIKDECKSVAWLGRKNGVPLGWEVILEDGSLINGATLKHALGKAAAYRESNQ